MDTFPFYGFNIFINYFIFYNYETKLGKRACREMYQNESKDEEKCWEIHLKTFFGGFLGTIGLSAFRAELLVSRRGGRRRLQRDIWKDKMSERGQRAQGEKARRQTFK